MDKNKQIYDVIEKAIDSQTAFGDLLTAEEKQTLIDHGTVYSSEVKFLVKFLPCLIHRVFQM